MINPTKTDFNSHTAWIRDSVRIHEALVKNAETKHKQNWLLLNALFLDRTITAWLKVTPFLPYQQMSDEEFKCSIRFRLGVDDGLVAYIRSLPDIIFKKGKGIEGSSSSASSNPNTASTNNQVKCPLCGTAMTEQHYSSCQATGPIRTARHNMVKKLIANLLSELPPVSIKVEDTHFSDDAVNDQKLIPDITVTLLDPSQTKTELEVKYGLARARETKSILKFGIDFVISDIYAIHLKQYTKDNKFAEAGEIRKWKHYTELNKQSFFKVLPFGLSSVGGIGPCGYNIIEFIKEVANRHKTTTSIQSTLEQLSFLIETSRYQMKEAYIATIHERLRRTKMSLPKETIQLEDIMTAQPSQLSKVNNSGFRPFWARQFEIQQQLDAGSNIARMVKEREQLQNPESYPWLSVAQKKDVPQSANMYERLSIAPPELPRITDTAGITPRGIQLTDGESSDGDMSLRDSTSPTFGPPSGPIRGRRGGRKKKQKKKKGVRGRRRNRSDDDEDWEFGSRRVNRFERFTRSRGRESPESESGDTTAILDLIADELSGNRNHGESDEDSLKQPANASTVPFSVYGSTPPTRSQASDIEHHTVMNPISTPLPNRSINITPVIERLNTIQSTSVINTEINHTPITEPLLQRSISDTHN